MRTFEKFKNCCFFFSFLTCDRYLTYRLRVSMVFLGATSLFRLYKAGHILDDVGDIPGFSSTNYYR